MNEPPPASRGNPVSIRPEEIQANLRKLDQRQWWMWSSAVMVMLLLTLGVASFAFPSLLSQAEGTYSFFLSQSVRALLGLVLLFCVYLIYQQLTINRIRRQVADQMDSMAKVEVLTEEVYKLAVLDPLTGLHNRRAGEQRLEEEISRSRRYGRPLTLLLVDVDDLKQANDKHGHAAGDMMLREFSERLRKAIRGSDMAVRLGGDEFMVILPECPAGEIGNVIRRLSGLEISWDAQKIPCTFSAGWTDLRVGDAPQDLLERADQALYANKRAAKDPNQLGLPVPQPAR